MKKLNFLLCLTAFFLVFRSPRGFANEGKPVHHMKFRFTAASLPVDSLPATKPKGPNMPDSTIKEVPKSRKQLAPLPITRIKPIRIVKPKIIKPVIKVLH